MLWQQTKSTIVHLKLRNQFCDGVVRLKFKHLKQLELIDNWWIPFEMLTEIILNFGDSVNIRDWNVCWSEMKVNVDSVTTYIRCFIAAFRAVPAMVVKSFTNIYYVNSKYSRQSGRFGGWKIIAEIHSRLKNSNLVSYFIMLSVAQIYFHDQKFDSSE